MLSILGGGYNSNLYGGVMNTKQKQLAFELYLSTIFNNVDYSKNANGEYTKDSTIAWFKVWCNGYEFGGGND